VVELVIVVLIEDVPADVTLVVKALAPKIQKEMEFNIRETR